MPRTLQGISDQLGLQNLDNDSAQALIEKLPDYDAVMLGDIKNVLEVKLMDIKTQLENYIAKYKQDGTQDAGWFKCANIAKNSTATLIKEVDFQLRRINRESSKEPTKVHLILEGNPEKFKKELKQFAEDGWEPILSSYQLTLSEDDECSYALYSIFMTYRGKQRFELVN